MLATGPQELAAFFHEHGMRWRLASFQRLRRELQEAHPVELAPFAALIDNWMRWSTLAARPAKTAERKSLGKMEIHCLRLNNGAFE